MVARRHQTRYFPLSVDPRLCMVVVAMLVIVLTAIRVWSANPVATFVPATAVPAVVSVLVLAVVAVVAVVYARAISRDLQLADDRLLLTLESAGQVAWDWDLASGRDLWMGDLKTMFGLDASRFVGRPEDFHRRLHPDDRARVANAVAHARADRIPYRATFRVIRRDDSIAWVNANGVFLYDDNGRATRMLGIATDITEQTRAEAALRQSEEHFREIADAAPVLLWLSSADGLCTYVNQSWIDFTGRVLQQEMGTGWLESIHPQDRHATVETFMEACGQGHPFVIEYRLRRHDGAYRWMLDAGTPRLAPDGSVMGYIGSAMDITDLKAARRALSNLSQRLIEAQEAERVRVARELDDDVVQRVGLLTIELEALIRSLPAQSASIEARATEVRERASDVVAHLQALSHRLHSSKLDLLGIAATAASYCRELADRQNLTVEFLAEDVPNDLSPEVSLSLFRVLQEGLANAVAHSGVRTFEVTLRGAGEMVEIQIVDDGIGFDTDAALAGPGTGLIGLHQRLGVVGGQFDVESRPGAGTRMWARVPRIRRPAVDAEQASLAQPAARLSADLRA